ncbi:MAG: SDR family NAD(P)-dependent oxidoreductase [Acidimicrobiia bacterium]|nr:SDR family NAD(P)-dependent oxidoreductase [Acidimicrobiia bacterium]
MKTALVTGAARGLGRALVQHLAENNFYVYAGVRNLDEAIDYGTKVENVKKILLDVTSDLSIERAAEKIATEKGSVDLIINNAGLARSSAIFGGKEFVSDIPSFDRDKLLLMFDVNAISPMMVAKNFIDLMKNKDSFIVNVASKRASFQDDFNEKTRTSGYRASKLALVMFTKCLVDYLPENVKTFAVHPNEVITEMNPNGEFTPEEASDALYKLIENFDPNDNGKFLNYDGSIYPI